MSELGYGSHCVTSLADLRSAIGTTQPPLLVLATHLDPVDPVDPVDSGWCGDRPATEQTPSPADAPWQDLRRSGLPANVPILAIVPAQGLDRSALLAAGATDYLLLPLVAAEVRSRLQLHLNQARMRELQDRAHNLTVLRGPALLAAHLQKRLRRQAELLREQVFLLDREVHDRRQAELALREEQTRTQKLLLNVLPQAIVDRLAQKDHPEMGNDVMADRFEEATILFADIVDFTPLSVQLAPLELVKLLNQIFSAFDRLAEEFGLEKIKTIGDAYMVVGGVPVPHPNHAISIMEMAIAMRREISQIRRETGLPLAIRIGINTGAVVAGVIGIKKFSYDLWGDAVNIASRMESQGIPGKIQVTEATYQYLKDHYEFERWSNVPVKGRGRMTAYLYVRRKEGLAPSLATSNPNLTGEPFAESSAESSHDQGTQSLGEANQSPSEVEPRSDKLQETIQELLGDFAEFC
ncbi:MAG: adenylate/guanylate cyclase domain-containing response regulator [Oscillatoriales cyanobacterium]|nr:MAG: adenylate/guanylate cyclase domain-containing response regulator [Oscillatoriales cyanobacterium]